MPTAAERAQANFRARFSRKELPTDLPVTLLPVAAEQLGLIAALVAAGLAASGTEARRKIAEGAVRIDGEKVIGCCDAAKSRRGRISLQLGPRRFAAGVESRNQLSDYQPARPWRRRI